MKLNIFNKIKLMKTFTLLFIITVYLSQSIKSDSVCSLKTLKTEILEDLADNGMLDCLRVIEKPHFKEETEKEKNLRIKAQWDSSCSFEANNSWIIPLKEQLGINDLVDVYGNIVKEDFEDQADMCEIVRAAFSKNLFDVKNVDLREIPNVIVDRISCAGAVGDIEGPRICAASSGSYFNKHTWAIFLTPTIIKFAGKPDFTKKAEIENHEKTEAEAILESPSVIKELIKYDADQFRNKGGLIAKLISRNKTLTSSVEENIVKINKPLIRHHNASGLATLNRTKVFSPISISGIQLSTASKISVFSFYMISYKLFPNQILSTHFTIDGKEVPETRQKSGPLMVNAISSAFVRNIDTDGFTHGITMEYSSNNNGVIDSNGITSNFSFVSIEFPLANYYHAFNTEPIELEKKTNRFTSMDHLRLIVRHDKDYDANYIIFYNVSVKISDSVHGELLGTVLKKTDTDSNNEIIETTQIKGRAHFLSNHSATIVNLSKDSISKFEIGYIYSGESNIVIRNERENNSIASISALELPRNTVIHTYKPERNIILDSKTWKNFGFNAKLRFDKKTKLLIMFNFNIKITKMDLTLRLVVNGKHAVRSLMSFSGVDNASGQGYVVETLDEGSYYFDIEFTSSAKGTILANNNNISMKLTRQFLTMTIIELDY